MKEEARPLSPSEFLEQINEVLAEQVAWVEGEVTDVRVSKGKWLHFGLKDEESLVNCFGFVFRIRTQIEDGMKVRVWGVPRVYPKYGKFSINVEIVEPAGEGALRRAFELLKKKLEAEGLFALERKRALPKFPENIGLITSPDAAACSDFLKVLQARRGGIEVLFIPVAVQGRKAPWEIQAAVEQFNEEYPALDALVLVRGGGSLEELQAFNDERVVRAIARSRIPTVVGVGHERDVSLADLVADVRGSTPSNAAELLTRTREEIHADLSNIVSRLHFSLTENLRRREREITRAVSILHESVSDSLEYVSSLAQRMATTGRLFAVAIERRFSAVQNGVISLHRAVLKALEEYHSGIRVVERVMFSFHPQRVLARGYSITKDDRGVVLRDAKDTQERSKITSVLHRGTLTSTIDKLSLCPPKNPSTSRKHTKSSKRLSQNSRQETLI